MIGILNKSYQKEWYKWNEILLIDNNCKLSVRIEIINHKERGRDHEKHSIRKNT